MTNFSWDKSRHIKETFPVLKGIIYPFEFRNFPLRVHGFSEDFFLLYQRENQQKLYNSLPFEIPEGEGKIPLTLRETFPQDTSLNHKRSSVHPLTPRVPRLFFTV